MTEQERIKANADKGYILVASFDGWDIHKKQNEVGGWTYYSDRVANEGAFVIWDTVANSTEELMALVKDIMPGAIDQESDLGKAFKEFWEAFGEYLKRKKQSERQ